MNRVTIDQIRTNPKAKEKFFSSLTDAELLHLASDWSFFARDEQLPPVGSWSFWMYLAGRGAGKTRTGAEWTREKIKEGFIRGSLIAPTASAARDVMVEGESGLINVCSKYDKTHKGEKMGKPLYEPSKRRVTWGNGAVVTLYSADEPERLRGPQSEFIWADELCAWRKAIAWDLAIFGLRLGKNPQAFISTTPKPMKLILDLSKDKTCIVTRGSTYSNAANLSPQFIDQIVKKYEGTRLGQQELEGLLIEQAEGALWNRKLLDGCRLKDVPDGLEFVRIVVAVDPAISANEGSSNETGIIVCGLGDNGKGYVLDDYSGVYTPAAWAHQVRVAYDLWQADRVIAEGNQGGLMVKHTIQSAGNDLNVTIVHASRGKVARAEPISAKFEQGQAFIVGALRTLEDQLCNWEPLSGQASPDRLDAMVWGLTDCLLSAGVTGQQKMGGYY